jgi:hypothetical protein
MLRALAVVHVELDNGLDPTFVPPGAISERVILSAEHVGSLLAELGRAVKTIFLARYLHNPAHSRIEAQPAYSQKFLNRSGDSSV